MTEIMLITTDWASNMPRPYYDTQFSDSPNLDNFTVGSHEPRNFEINKEYYTYMGLVPGSASSVNTVLIKGQRGFRNPSSCFSTWCVFALQTTEVMLRMKGPQAKTLYTY